MSAASATRSSTTVSGGNSRSTTPLKKNEPPHSTDSTASSDQSRASILMSLDVICGSAIQDRADAYGKGRNAGHPIPETASRRRKSCLAPCAGVGRRAAVLPDISSYLRRQRPTVGGVEHLAPSAAPPPGQNTDTSVSFASQLAAPSPCTALTPAGPASPLSPLSPLAPGAPCGPCGPCAPCGPGCPCGPGGPAGPCAPGCPWAPATP